jgi:hypothetical protein
MTNIFLSNGRINPDIDPSEIPEARRAQFIALVSAQHGCERAESEEKIANDAVAAAVRIHDHAHAAVPRSTFLDEHRAAVAAWGRR